MFFILFCVSIREQGCFAIQMTKSAKMFQFVMRFNKRSGQTVQSTVIPAWLQSRRSASSFSQFYGSCLVWNPSLFFSPLAELSDTQGPDSQRRSGPQWSSFPHFIQQEVRHQDHHQRGRGRDAQHSEEVPPGRGKICFLILLWVSQAVKCKVNLFVCLFFVFAHCSI